MGEERTDCGFQIINKCQAIGLPYKYVPNLYNLAIQKVRVEEIDGIPLFGVKEPSYNALNAFFKRIFDIAFSVITLIALSPLMLILAICIRLDSPGPAIFKQKRVGKDGKIFTLYKFRTMFKEAPKYAKHPEENDPRITRFGRFLRRTSGDELLQLINVLKEDMSIVGPRPEMPFIVETCYQ